MIVKGIKMVFFPCRAEDTNKIEEGQDSVESNANDNTQEQDIITSEESPESDDNTIDSQLTNST